MRITTQAFRQASRHAFRVALALTLTATPAAAQFTAVVQPPKARPAATADAAQATPGARSDSAGRTALTDMRAWVDSAAGVIAPDSAAPADTTKRDSTHVWPSSAAAVVPADSTPIARDARAAGDGTRAPDTATTLPGIAVFGLAMLAAGAWLLRRSARA